MQRARVGLSLAACLLAGCATFNSEMAKQDLTKAQEHLETEAQFRLLTTAYLAEAHAIPIHLRRLAPERAVELFKPLDPNRQHGQEFRALFDELAFFSFGMGEPHSSLVLRWHVGGPDVRLVSHYTSPDDFVLLTGEAKPEDCHAEQRGPDFPVLASIFNPTLKWIGFPLFDTRPHEVTLCPSANENARVAPLATGLSVALDSDRHAKEAGLSPDHYRSPPLAVVVRPALAQAHVVLCASARSWSGSAQLAIRYEASLSELDRFFANEPKAVPLEKAPFERSVVFITADRRFTEGDDGAVDCLDEPFGSPLSLRIKAMKAARRKRLEAAR